MVQPADGQQSWPLRVESERLSKLSSAIFTEVSEWKREARNLGRELIDLGIGSPDRPPSDKVIEAMVDAVKDPAMYGYPTSEGSAEFRQAVARWYKHRFDVDLDATSEVVTLMGSQDGLAHLALAVADPGDLALVPDPGYPIYAASLAIAGVEPYYMPLREENSYLPDLDRIDPTIADKAKFILLNYPSNPLSATADLDFFQRLVAFARKHRLLLVHDLAYSEMAFDGFRPPSVLQIDGAKDVAVEFHSLSKSFNMAGCRIAYMVGNASAVRALSVLKSNIDYGVFTAVQRAGIAALEQDIAGFPGVAQEYEKRRDLFLEVLARYGWHVSKPQATMFIWARIPKGWTSRQISREILLQTGVVVIPGDAFGAEGEGYVRIALVQEVERLAEAAHRLGAFLQQHHV